MPYFVVKADSALGTGYASQEEAIAAAKERARINPEFVFYIGAPVVKVWTPPAQVVADPIGDEAAQAVSVELLKPSVEPKPKGKGK